ncbi:MAG TPA: hypothetical protein VF691_15575 [Cytophagaceae bacterium]|jgi:hypothetical protein
MDLNIIVGGGLIIVFGFLVSYMKAKAVYYSLLGIAIVLAVIRIYYGDELENIVGISRGNTSNFLFSPLIYLIVFGILRMIFIEIYKKEPVFRSYLYSNYDYVAKRNQTLADHAVQYIPVFVAVLWPYIVTKLF